MTGGEFSPRGFLLYHPTSLQAENNLSQARAAHGLCAQLFWLAVEEEGGQTEIELTFQGCFSLLQPRGLPWATVPMIYTRTQGLLGLGSGCCLHLGLVVYEVGEEVSG